MIGNGPGVDAGGGGAETSTPEDGAGGTEAAADAPVDSPVGPGEQRACPSAKRITQTANDRVVFEPYGLIVDGTGRLVAWEESKTKRRATPENAAAGASRVSGCCASFGVNGGLVYGHTSELDVKQDAAFALHTLVRRTNGGAPAAGGGAMVVKKPTALPPFTGFALTVAGRDPSAGLEDKPAFQLQYEPRIFAIDTTSFPVATLTNFSGIRASGPPAELTVQIGTRRLTGAYDNLDVSNDQPMFIGGGGDTHFVGEICALILEVGDQSGAEARSNALGAYTP